MSILPSGTTYPEGEVLADSSGRWLPGQACSANHADTGLRRRDFLSFVHAMTPPTEAAIALPEPDSNSDAIPEPGDVTQACSLLASLVHRFRDLGLHSYCGACLYESV